MSRADVTKRKHALQKAAMAVYMYDRMYPENTYVPVPLMRFIEEAQEKYSRAYWRAMDCMTCKEIEETIHQVCPEFEVYI